MCRFANIQKSLNRRVIDRNQEVGAKVEMTLVGYGNKVLILVSWF
jgi:hypothetical protein